MFKSPTIYMLNGPGGAGKTTASRLLAKEFEQCALIEVDEIRKLIVQGEADPFTGEGQEQLMLSTKNTALLAQSYIDAGFSVIIDDCIAGKERLDYYFEAFEKNDFKVALVLPSEQTLIERDNRREGRARLGKDKIEWLYNRFSERLPSEDRWKVVDNTDLTPEATVSKILEVFNN